MAARAKKTVKQAATKTAISPRKNSPLAKKVGKVPGAKVSRVKVPGAKVPGTKLGVKSTVTPSDKSTSGASLVPGQPKKLATNASKKAALPGGTKKAKPAKAPASRKQTRKKPTANRSGASANLSNSSAAAILAERDALQAELAVAKARIAELEKLNEEAVNRIDWVIDSLQSVLSDTL